MVPSVDVVSHEEIVGVWGLTSDFEELFQVVELAVDITANGDRCSHLRYVRLVNQNFFSLVGGVNTSQ